MFDLYLSYIQGYSKCLHQLLKWLIQRYRKERAQIQFYVAHARHLGYMFLPVNWQSSGLLPESLPYHHFFCQYGFKTEISVFH
jgi:hypothetical protein